MRSTVIIWCLIWAVPLAGAREIDFQKFIDEVNEVETTWTAGHNFPSHTPYRLLKRLAGGSVRRINETRRHGQLIMSDMNDTTVIPTEFDARKQWPHCTSIKEIHDQGACASDWAQAVADTFTDRICIATKGQVKTPRSAEEILTCCSECKDEQEPCHGGTGMNAWNYIKANGVGTGGEYQSQRGCQPYTFPPCDHNPKHKGDKKQCTDLPEPKAPACSQSCTNEHYKKKFNKDHRTINGYYFFNEVKDAQKDLMMNGPLSSVILVFEDFYNYKSGVYKFQTGKLVGEHTIRVIGWGVEDGVDYWLVANNWNADWGDNGFFKIARGIDECDIEVGMMGASVKK